MTHPEFAHVGGPAVNLIEECAELIQALTKLQRFGPGLPPYDNVAQVRAEIADVQQRISEWLAAPLPASPAQPVVAAELPDSAELEAWRSTADDLLRCASSNAALTRRAAFLLQNAYLFCSKLTVIPKVEAPVAADAPREYPRSFLHELMGEHDFKLPHKAFNAIVDALCSAPVARAEGEAPKPTWGYAKTVGNAIAQLQTMDATLPFYAALHLEDGRCIARGVTFSRERVVNERWIDNANKDVPYSIVVWSQPVESLYAATPKAEPPASGFRAETDAGGDLGRGLGSMDQLP